MGPWDRRTGKGPARQRLRVRTVLFDLDDTLFDHRGSVVRGLEALREGEPLLRRWPVERLARRYQQLLDQISPGQPGAPATHGEARTERFRRLCLDLGGSDDLAEAGRWSERYREAYQAARRPVPGVPALLRALHGRTQVGIVTNNHTLEQVGKLQHLGLSDWIDFMVTSEDAGFSKPDLRIFELALYRAGCGPLEAVMVGDTWATDIVGAAVRGIPAVWLNRGPGRRPTGLRGVVEVRALAPARPLARLLLSGTLRPARPSARVRANG
jgi:putative hydrolase of the HAD superfamily